MSAQERRRRLEEIDPWWAPSWLIVWQRHYASARTWRLAADGHVRWDDLVEDVVYEGVGLGRWVRAQRAGWAGLVEQQ
ncbi:hypothetical protein AB0442_40150 [Kitasatospora sp. NPDC085895]|uniref:hypothetical protein n=1 Tax=Kitasatospora sp. NPDC085895 TaxID=3155057 RepID=UPI00344FEB67